MTCGVTDTKKDQTIVLLGKLHSFCIPDLPCYRVIHMSSDLLFREHVAIYLKVARLSHKGICFGAND